MNGLLYRSTWDWECPKCDESHEATEDAHLGISVTTVTCTVCHTTYRVDWDWASDTGSSMELTPINP